MPARSTLSAVLFALVGLVLFSSAASAQSAITGVVRDATGLVMPGATVEAASPALIERIRTVSSDAQGRYTIVDLRPGVYKVTFSLAGVPDRDPGEHRPAGELHRNDQCRARTRSRRGVGDGVGTRTDGRCAERPADDGD